ncbi:MAG: hypothetical protein FJY29_09035 [Betaproteobacteria bacterium]|nr:hypothetical protein [Betaproteobacteria bacterium]
MLHPNGTTQMLALFGEDLRLSPSPATHTAWAEQAGLNWVYLPMPCQNETAFMSLCSALMECSGFQGGNITNPFKRSALNLPGVKLDGSAELCRAANTLYRVSENNQSVWRLANTDLAGCSETLSRILRSVNEQGDLNAALQFVILGTGAMADTCAQAISIACGHQHNSSTTLLSRTQLERGEILKHVPQNRKSHIVVINALPSGTRPEADRLASTALEELDQLPVYSKHLFEISYLETPASKHASSSGWGVTRGEILFEEQARASFKLWARCSASNSTTALQPSRE